MSGEECNNPEHGGHKVYVGGIMDGHVAHVLAPPDRSPGDYGMSVGTVKKNGQRTWYLRDAEFAGTTATYRAVAVSADAPPEIVATYPTPANQGGQS